MCRFKVGDRVIRPKNVHNPKLGIMHGIVTLVYGFKSQWFYPDASWNKHWPPYSECYDVCWDHKPNEIAKGYLPHGLSLE